LRGAFDSFESLNHKYNGTFHSDANSNLAENQSKDLVTSKSVVSKVEYIEDKLPVEQSSEVLMPNDKNIPILLAKKTENGFLLLDENKRLEFELLKTSQESIFITSYNKSNGIFILKGNQSRFEYYVNDTLTVKEYNVKF
jgi:hypothetical protein